MPELCRFFGIVITMYYRDHSPPHFHARYGGCTGTITLDGFALLSGDLPPRALGLIVEWASLHRSELLEDWARARALQPLLPIEPLQ